MDGYRIREAGRLSGLSAHSIRFYEERGLLPPVARSESGYRVYSMRDVRRLRLIRNLRRLGVPLNEVSATADEAFGSECGHYLRQLSAVLARQEATVRDRLLELQALAADIEALRAEAEGAASKAPEGSLVDECPCCPLIDDGTADGAYCAPGAAGMTKGWEAVAPKQDLLEVLSCDIGVRPAAAPGVHELMAHLRRMERREGKLTLTFGEAARAAVTEFMAAEQRCCAQLGFAMSEVKDGVTLTVMGTPAQAEAFATLWLDDREATDR